MSLPFLPLLQGDDHSDIAILYNYLNDLISAFPSAVNEAVTVETVNNAVAADPDTGWSISGTSEAKVLNSGDTLTVTQDVIATIIEVLIAKGILSA